MPAELGGAALCRPRPLFSRKFDREGVDGFADDWLSA